MNKYESIIILVADIAEEKKTEIINKITELINTDGKMNSVEEIGKKKLAYEIRKNTEGYYVLFNFESNPNLIPELERNYRIIDEIIKFIVVRIGED